MYFNGTLAIDPSQLTRISTVRPANIFDGLWSLLRGNGYSEQQEEETFTAVSILNQVYNAFQSIGIDNLVRLTYDGQDYDVDSCGRKMDLRAAIRNFEGEVSRQDSTMFNQLTMVVEHETDEFKCLIETEINRTHEVGTYPIIVRVSGLLPEFRSHLNCTFPDLIRSVATLVESQQSLDDFRDQRRQAFSDYLKGLENAFRQVIHVDDITTTFESRVVLSHRMAPSSPRLIPSRYQSNDAVFQGYFQLQEYTWYLYQWPSLLQHFELNINQITVVDTSGKRLGLIRSTNFRRLGKVLFNAGIDWQTRLDTLQVLDATARGKQVPFRLVEHVELARIAG